MKAAKRVVVVTDVTAEAFDRCWVVLEAHLAHVWEKSYDISLPDNGCVEEWKIVGEKLQAIDMSKCKASVEADRVAILEYAKSGEGGVDGLNQKVRKEANQAEQRVTLFTVVASGNLDYFDENDIGDQALNDWRGFRGNTLVHVSARFSRIAILVEILRRTSNCHLSTLDGFGNSPLCIAIQVGSLASVQALIRLKADVDIPTQGGLTPLHLAAAGGNTKIIAALLGDALLGDQPCLLEAQGTFEGFKGLRPLIIAAKKGHAGTVRMLLERKADLNAHDHGGFSALHHAAIEGMVDAVMSLLSMRAEVDAREKQGRTALMFACNFGKTSVVSVLLGAGASVAAVSEEKKEAMDHAKKYMKTCEQTSADMQVLLKKVGHCSDLRRVLAIFKKAYPEGDMPMTDALRFFSGLNVNLTEKSIRVFFEQAGAIKPEEDLVDYQAALRWVFD